MAMSANEKAKFMMRKLATGVYRPLFWSRYKDPDKNRAFGMAWAGVLGRFELKDISEGLERWHKEQGDDRLPEPQAFAEYLMPKHTPVSRQSLSSIKQRLVG
jgi:hypothetical protein